MKIIACTISLLLLHLTVFSQDTLSKASSENEISDQPATSLNGAKAESDYGHDIIAFNPMDLAFKRLTFSWEFSPYEQKMGYKVPISFGLENKDYFSSGLYFKWYPTSSAGELKYFVGPYFQIAGDKEYYYFAIQLDNGLSFQPLKALNISLDFSIGPGAKAQHADVPDFFKGAPKEYYTAWLVGLSVGWRF